MTFPTTPVVLFVTDQVPALFRGVLKEREEQTQNGSEVVVYFDSTARGRGSVEDVPLRRPLSGSWGVVNVPTCPSPLLRSPPSTPPATPPLVRLGP